MESVVTDLTKVVHGVRTRVLVEQDINAGQLAEAELAFEAQDDAGNVWSLGEYPEEYEDGKFAGAPDVWIAGVAGARAGVSMPAKPRLGLPNYRQGFAPDIEFFDCARVLKTGARTCVPGKCYDNVVVLDEWDPLDPESGHQRKFHADGVGIVRVAPVNDPEVVKTSGRGGVDEVEATLNPIDAPTTCRRPRRWPVSKNRGQDVAII